MRLNFWPFVKRKSLDKYYRDEIFFNLLNDICARQMDMEVDLTELKEVVMDKKIAKIQKENKKEGKDLASLKKMDKKRDKVCDMGEKAMKKKK